MTVNPFETLGLTPDADQTAVHEAYRKLAKVFHPDQFEQGSEQQQAAQEKMTAINVAYEEAMSLSSKRPSCSVRVTAEAAESMAERMLEAGSFESALLQLCRAENKDGRWFYLQGKALMGLKQYSSAHQSFREAVRFEPENRSFRQGALDAAVEMKKHNRISYKVADWFDGLLHPRKKL